MAAVDKLWAWNSPPKNWLVAVDRNAATHLDAVQRVIDFLRRQSLDVFVPETVEGLTHLSNVSFVSPDSRETLDNMDVVVCFDRHPGRAHVSSLYPHSVPVTAAIPLKESPPADLDDDDDGLSRHVAFALRQLQRGHGYVVERHRLRCRVEPGSDSPSRRDVPELASSPFVPALHEVVLHRVPHPTTIYCRLLIEDVHVTTVIGDGLVICTPSGSTGYARTAGAAAMDVSLRCMQICPINPNSLAFRPLVLPAHTHVRLEFESQRSDRPLTLIVDGRPLPLFTGDTVELESAEPMPTLRMVHPRGRNIESSLSE